MKTIRLAFWGICLLYGQLLWAQNPTLQVQLGHTDWLSRVAFSPDGSFLITASQDKTLKVWETKQWKLLRTLEGHQAKIHSFTFSPSGKFIISADNNGEIIFWKTEDGTIVRQISEFQEAILQMTFLPQTNIMLLLMGDKSIIALDAEKQTIIWQLPAETYQPLCMAISPDGKLLATGAENGVLTFRNPQNGKKIKDIEAHISSINDVVFTPDGNQIITAGKDKRIRLWNKNGEPIDDFTGHKAPVLALALSADGKQLASASEDKTFRLWDMASKTLIRITEAHSFAVTCISFSPDSRYTVTGSEDNTAKIWENLTGQLIGVAGLNRNFALALQFDESGNKLIIGNRNRNVQILQFNNGKIIGQWGGHNGSVNTIVPHPNGWLTAGSDGNVILRNQQGEPIANPFSIGNKKEFSGIGYLAGRIGAVSATDNKIWIWNENGQVFREIAGTSAYLKSLQAHPEAKRWAVASGEARLRTGIHQVLLLTEKGEIAQTIQAHTGVINQIQFSPSGMYLATASYDKTAKIWETSTGKLIRQFSGHTDAVFCVAFHPEGQILATGSFDNTIRIWDIPTQTLLKTINAHDAWVWSLAFSPDGKYLVSSSTDTRLKVWQTDTWQEKLSLILLNNGTDYVITTPEGIFDGTQTGIQQALHFTNKNTVIPLSSLYEKYYAPSLWATIMQGEKPSVKPDNTRLTPAPDVRFLLSENETRGFKPITPAITANSLNFTVSLEVTDKGGGIDEVRLFQNGKLVATRENSYFINTQPDKIYRLDFPITLIAGNNELTATAFNSQRTESIPVRIHIKYEGKESNPQANLYILAVGVNNYKNPRYNLSYAQKDAQTIVQALRKAGQGIFAEIVAQEYYNQEATASNIKQGFQRIIRQANPQDVFIFYYAGHGAMSEEGQNAQFFLCPYEVTQLYGSRAELEKTAISAEELQQLSMSLKAQKQLFLLDACQSGGATHAFSKRGVAEEKAIVQLARSTGLAVIAASGQDQYATEIQAIGHGVFTYTILEGLKGAADGGIKDGKITVGEIRSFASDYIPEISAKYKGTPQYPTSFISGQDFPIGTVK